MRVELLRKLTAPGGGEVLRPASVSLSQDGEIIEGAAFAPGRGLYPIQQGILNLLPRGPGTLSLAQQSNRWGLVARFYEWPWRTNSTRLLSGGALTLRREQAIFKEMLGEGIGDLWLDLGASTALYARWLSSALEPGGGEVVALDFAWPMLHRARHVATQEGHDNLSFVRARAEQLPFATGTLAGVVCGGSLNEFGQPGASLVLAEVARTLRPGGVGLFMHLLEAEAGAVSLFQQYLASPAGIAFWSRAEIDKLFHQAGLQIDTTQVFGGVGFTRIKRGDTRQK